MPVSFSLVGFSSALLDRAAAEEHYVTLQCEQAEVRTHRGGTGTNTAPVIRTYTDRLLKHWAVREMEWHLERAKEVKITYK